MILKPCIIVVLWFAVDIVKRGKIMKKISLLIITAWFVIPAYADVQIQFQNVPKGNSIFIVSLADNKTYPAIMTGNIAIVPDSELSEYSAGLPFIVEVDTGVTSAYCYTSIDKPSLFIIKYLKTSPNLIALNLLKTKEGGFAVCSSE